MRFSSFRLLAGSFTLSSLLLLLSAPLTQANPTPAESIGPLEARSIDFGGQSTVGLSSAADAINAEIWETRNADSAPVGWDLKTLPLIGDWLDEDGNLDLGTEFPVSVDFDDIEGGTSVMVEERRSVDSLLF